MAIANRQKALSTLKRFKECVEEFNVASNTDAQSEADQLSPVVSKILLELGLETSIIVDPPPIYGGLRKNIDAIGNWHLEVGDQSLIPHALRIVGRGIGLLSSDPDIFESESPVPPAGKPVPQLIPEASRVERAEMILRNITSGYYWLTSPVRLIRWAHQKRVGAGWVVGIFLFALVALGLAWFFVVPLFPTQKLWILVTVFVGAVACGGVVATQWRAPH